MSFPILPRNSCPCDAQNLASAKVCHKCEKELRLNLQVHLRCIKQHGDAAEKAAEHAVKMADKAENEAPRVSCTTALHASKSANEVRNAIARTQYVIDMVLAWVDEDYPVG
jgi:hypothetical protein